MEPRDSGGSSADFASTAASTARLILFRLRHLGKNPDPAFKVPP